MLFGGLVGAENHASVGYGQDIGEYFYFLFEYTPPMKGFSTKNKKSPINPHQPTQLKKIYLELKDWIGILLSPDQQGEV